MPRNRSETFTWTVGDRVTLWRPSPLGTLHGVITLVRGPRASPDHRIDIQWAPYDYSHIYTTRSHRWLYERDEFDRQLTLIPSNDAA